MLTRVPTWLRRSTLLLPLLLLACPPAGCQRSDLDRVKLVLVSGKITVKDKGPLTSGTLSFRPNAARGNENKFEPASDIDENGNYHLRTEGREGAPVGWYKVLVVSADPVDPNAPYATRKSYVSAIYNAPTTTDLEVEITENPAAGAYDLTVEP